MQELGLEGRTDGRTAPRAGEGGRQVVLGARGCVPRRAGAGKPPSRPPGGLGVAPKFGAGGPGSEKANVGRGRARHEGETWGE